jgi:hypothetical protein
MEQEILNVFIGQGACCLLCVIALGYFTKKASKREEKQEERYTKIINDNRKDSKERESKYQQMIDRITDKFAIVEEIKNDVDYIKEKISK